MRAYSRKLAQLTKQSAYELKRTKHELRRTWRALTAVLATIC